MSAYRVHLLADPKATDRGVVYRRGDRRYLLEWKRVQVALAAEVGEHQGVATVLIDLAVEVEGAECVVCRLDTDPGAPAQSLARAVELGVGRDRCHSSLRATANDGWPTRSYPDVESFEGAALESIRFR